MNKILLFLLASTLTVQANFAQSNVEDELVKKINERPYPQWFKDAKLGIFIHWGLYSVPSYGSKESYAEWFLRGIQTNDTLRTKFMKDTYGQNFTYKDFANEFKAELFNPDEWSELFKKAGAKYVMLVTKHHDGYALWPSKYNRNWNSVDTGPKRDIVGELTESVRNAGLKMGLYYSLSEWNHPLHKWYTDPHDQIGPYVEQYMIPQFKELVSTYRPSLIFADGEWFNTAKQWHSAELIDWYYNLVGEDALVNNRWGHGIDTGFLTPEYSAGIKVTDRPWAEVRGIGRSFGLNRNEDLEAYGTPQELIHRFVQTVANGGGMILNVGPGADGQIPLIQQERLVQLGDWLKLNDEAIYGSTTYKVKEEEKIVSIQRVDAEINFNWVRNSPMKGIKEDNFDIEWNGYITVPNSDTYTFETKADDEVVVFIDNKTIINQNYTATGTQSEVMGAKTTASTNGTIKLDKGKVYPITIKYREKKQNASVALFWKTKKTEQQIVPGAYLFQDKDTTKNGLIGDYSSLQTYLCYTQNNGNIYAISFEWPEDELVLSIEDLGANATIKMVGLDRKLDWEFKDGKVVVNTANIKYNEIPSHDAWAFEISKK
ncbi:alpha-L-fucosidase [Urechidicola vernalis]|uniref:alpha-L-fucosidase n=1 Tax=Urechidicola vernalis TaxID=3075600 RepID=A0ABU2Y4G4_9FLAO|nr:alpha-L-fucosidase [Urechidicola sp. P050]MDT0553066.1 alpha-L-fucosidase [Urechidicola sp. P050]